MPRLRSQKMDAKADEKNIPSTAANATNRSPNGFVGSVIQCIAHAAFAAMVGILLMALVRRACSSTSSMRDVSMFAYASACTFSLSCQSTDNSLSDHA